MQILFEDDQILVINKPPNLVSTPAETHSGKTLADILNEDYGIPLERGGLVHRLDKDTSGVIVAAKTIEAFENLQNQFKERTVKKEYLALVHGETEEHGSIEASIGRNPIKHDKFTVIEDGRESATDYKRERFYEMEKNKMDKLFGRVKDSNYSKFSLLRCFPRTGRTHQIRVHLKYINHPIVSDERYVGRKTFKLDSKWCPRVFLHAERIEFRHPTTGKVVNIKCDLPEDLKTALESLTESVT